MTSCWILNGSIVVIIRVGSFLPDATVGVWLCPQTSQSFGQSETFDWTIWSQILDQSFAVFFVLRRILYQQRRDTQNCVHFQRKLWRFRKFPAIYTFLECFWGNLIEDYIRKHGAMVWCGGTTKSRPRGDGAEGRSRSSVATVGGVNN